MPRIYNKKTGTASADAIYVGRPTKWGNPFQIGKDGSRKQVIEKYQRWLCDQPELLKDINELRGKDLVCWCAPLCCHAEILRALANDELTEKNPLLGRVLIKSDLGEFL